MKPLPIGLALSGGTAKSVLHVGVIRALLEANIPINYIAGTSGGSIAAVACASGMPMDQMAKFAVSLRWWKLAKITIPKLGFVSSAPIEKFMEGVLPQTRFEELDIPCAIPVTNLVTGNKEVFRSGPIARVVRASCSIPQIYSPVAIHGEHYVDGGLSEYLPVETVQEFGEQFTIAVNLANKYQEYEKPKNILQLIMQVTNMVARQNIAHSTQRTDFLIHPDIDHYSSFDFGNAEELMEFGYEYTKQRTDALVRAWRRKSGWLQRFGRWFSQ